MIRRLAVVIVMMFSLAATVRAEQRAAATANNALNDLLRASTDLANEAQRDGEILRLLRDASRALDDFQQNTAIAKALENIRKAEQLAAQSSQRVAIAVQMAKSIVGPAADSPSSADLPKLREQLRSRPIEQMREVVAEEIGLLARLAARVSDVSGLMTKAVASASATTLGVKSE
jgi:hypothetical protein